jgi:hypothetical protein
MNAHRVATLLAPVVVAVVLGPLVVSIGLWLVNTAPGLVDPESSLSFAEYRGALILMVIMTYVIGWPIALLAGILVSLWMIRRPPSALTVNAAAVIATAVFMGVSALGVFGPVEQFNGRNNLLFTLIAALVAANVCWLLLRRFALKAALGVK